MDKTKPIKLKLTSEQKLIHELSERIVTAQKPIRVLDSLKWGPEIEKAFLKHKGKELPKVDKNYYTKNPLPYDPEKKKTEFHAIERDIQRQLGQFSGVGSIMLRMCHEYRATIDMIKTRGTNKFSGIAIDLYGSSLDAFYPGSPRLIDLPILLSDLLKGLKQQLATTSDEKKFTGAEAIKILNDRMHQYFCYDKKKNIVMLSDNIVADATAGAEYIKLRKDSMFSERDLKLLEVHEGWVHIGTTLNGLAQPICTFLSKGTASSAITQEGLAVISEIFSFTCHPARVKRITDRVTAINMAEQGADFIEVFNYFQNQALSEIDSYNFTMRIFRGSTPTHGPFTKDLAYAKGFILIYNYLRLAVQEGLVNNIPLLFVGKTTIEDLHILNELLEAGIIVPPLYVPSQFKDLAGISSWMCFSLFMNKINLKKLSANYKHILHD